MGLSCIEITTRPVGVSVEILTIAFLEDIIAYPLRWCIDAGGFVHITSVTIHEGMDRPAVATVLHHHLQVTTTTSDVELHGSTMLNDLIDLGLVIVHVDVVSNAPLVVADLVVLEVHVECITQHHSVVLDTFRSQCGVHGWFP